MAVSGINAANAYNNYNINKTANVDNEVEDSGKKNFSLANASETYTTFSDSNNKLANSVSNGANYKTMTNQASSSAADCQDAGQAAYEQNGAAQNTTNSAHAVAQENQNFVTDKTNLIGQESDKVYTSQSNIKAFTARQEKVAAWLEEAKPNIEAMVQEIDNITAEALEACADFGEFETLDEAMAALNEAMAPKMEELAAKQAERQAKSEEQANLDPSDPDYDSKFDSLQGEIDGLDEEIGAIQEDEEFAGMSEAMSTLMDACEAIGELQEAIDGYQEDMDAKSAELETLDKGLNTETTNTTNSSNKVTTANKEVKTTQEKDEDEKSDWLKFLEGTEKVGDVTQTVGNITNTTGMVVEKVGDMLVSNPYTAAVGVNMIAVGSTCQAVGGWTTVAGGVVSATADVGLAVETGDNSYFLKAAKNAASAALSAASAIKATKAASEACKNAAAFNAAAKEGAQVTLAGGKVVAVQAQQGAEMSAEFTEKYSSVVEGNLSNATENVKKAVESGVNVGTGGAPTTAGVFSSANGTGVNGLATGTTGKASSKVITLTESSGWDRAAGFVEDLGNGASGILDGGVKIYERLNQDDSKKDDSGDGKKNNSTTTQTNTNKNVAGSGKIKKPNKKQA